MAQNKTDIIALIRTILSEHDSYYDSIRGELKKYRDNYATKFWNSSTTNDYDNMLRLETSDCFTFVETYIASLFSKNPAVVIGKDAVANSGNPRIAEAVANRFLFNQQTQIEIASRLALIYPSSFLKLSPSNSEDMLEKVQIRALPPWEVIVDMSASAWESQRFCGHVYYITLQEAKRKWGNKDFQAIAKEEYFETDRADRFYAKEDLPDAYLYIKVVELYDFGFDELYIWTPNLNSGEDLLERAEIPLRTYDEKPLSPIAPLFYNRQPEKPLCGLSAVARVYDQFYEKNIIRTYWANAVRRDSRQYIYKKGTFSDDELAKITAGIDGAMIGVDENSLDGLIRTIQVEPISTNFDRYLAQVEADINKGSILASFTQGVATQASATEINILQQYSASEIGKMARERDSLIENMATIYLRFVSLLSEDDQTAVIEVDGLPTIVKPDDLDSKFKVIALDQASTPFTDASKKQDLINLAPLLIQLGANSAKILEEIVRLYDFPKILTVIEEQQEEQAATAAMGVPPNGV